MINVETVTKLMIDRTKFTIMIDPVSLATYKTVLMVTNFRDGAASVFLEKKFLCRQTTVKLGASCCRLQSAAIWRRQYIRT